MVGKPLSNVDIENPRPCRNGVLLIIKEKLSLCQCHAWRKGTKKVAEVALFFEEKS